MKKFFFVIDTLGPGGSERVISELANNLSNKYKVYLVTINQSRNLKDFYPLSSKIKRIRLKENIENKNIILKMLRIINLYKNFCKLLKKKSQILTLAF